MKRNASTTKDTTTTVGFDLRNDSLAASPPDISDIKVQDTDTLSSAPAPLAVADTIPADSIKGSQKSGLDAIVYYSAKDSIVFTAQKQGFLFGEGEVNYQEINLVGEKISLDMDSSIIAAKYGIDSIGDQFGFPVFSDRSESVEAKTMRYNFKTKKGFITDAITQQGEGYIVAGKAKRNPDETFFIADARYTTCDEHDHPHFYIKLTKAKVQPKKNVVAGPAYLVIEDLPLPMLGLPFGFFPFSSKYSSGVIMPSVRDDMDRGFGLIDGGYYFAINDHIDLALTGELYTKGSWGLNAKSTYRKRYKYSGNIDVGYLVTKNSDKDSPDYSLSKDFSINWTHTQDPKFNMYRTLSASVQFRSSKYDRNQLNNFYNTDGTRASSISLSQRFPNSPFSITASMAINQTLRDSSVSITLPTMSISMSRIYPFKRKEAVGDEKWYEKIQLSYSGTLNNRLDTKEDKIFSANWKRDWKKNMTHRIPISATFNVFNYLNISPSVSYNENWYTEGVYRGWNGSSHVNMDTTYRFKRVYDYNFSLSFQTKLYGFYEPLFNFLGIKKIRHVFTPSISFNVSPDFTDPKYGFVRSYKYLDANGYERTYSYSPWGSMPSREQGAISFDFQNNIEAKVKNAQDSLVTKSIIDNLGVNFSYNLMADSLKLSDINMNMRLKLSKTLTVNLNAVFDPYLYGIDEGGMPVRIDKLRINKNGMFGRLRNTGYSISPSINQDTFKKWFRKSKDTSEGENNTDVEGEGSDTEDGESTKKRGSLYAKKKEQGDIDEDGYLKNDFRWNISASYSMSYGYTGEFDFHKMEYKRKLTHNLSFSGSVQPTKNWSLTFNSSYDFDRKKLAYMSCGITRNLHCWSISGNFIPIGDYTSYFVTLRVSSSILQDLKYEQRGRRTSYDPSWY
ncbi:MULTISPECIES: putative LPS assembly protein LptD [unclassified Dysgonomonas]|uniref:putative LPS assembly protein LptD n=1 Tax=unclassified Dysgonomonas TaxID=2630389 RepID=UPI002475AA9B|nr:MULTISPECIES: putative LPS assembly protein LptD [unclassified Dysgonomonas]